MATLISLYAARMWPRTACADRAKTAKLDEAGR